MKTPKPNPFKVGMALAAALFLSVSFQSCQKKNAVIPFVKGNMNFPSGAAFNAIPTTISDSLVAFWTLANTTYDLSGNKHNATVHSLSLTTDRFGHTSAAYSFNGTSSYLSVVDSLPLRLSGTDFTLNAWVKLTAYNTSAGSIIIDKRLTSLDTGYTWSITGATATTGGVVGFGPGGGGNNAFGTTVIGLSAWHMVTSIYTLSNRTLKIYVDGVLDNTTANVSAPSALNTASLYIGRDNPGLMDNGYFFKGAMNDIRIYSRAITTTEISQLYNALN